MCVWCVKGSVYGGQCHVCLIERCQFGFLVGVCEIMAGPTQRTSLSFTLPIHHEEAEGFLSRQETFLTFITIQQALYKSLSLYPSLSLSLSLILLFFYLNTHM